MNIYFQIVNSQRALSCHMSRLLLTLETEKSIFFQKVESLQEALRSLSEDHDITDVGYKELVFADLCISALDLYSDIVSKFSAKHELDSIGYRLMEEFEFLKNSFRSLLPESSSSDLSRFGVDKKKKLNNIDQGGSDCSDYSSHDMENESQLFLLALKN